MDIRYFCFALFLFLSTTVGAQVDLSYYLPEGTRYDPNIPTPKSVIGHEVGEWHVTHDKLVQYMQVLDAASDRVSLKTTGHTYEGRPLLLLTITSPKNHGQLENIRKQHLQLCDPGTSGSLNIKNMPAVFYLGCSIHGNEQSGSNAGLLLANHLAAAQGEEINAYLENTIILFDPSLNPDGMQRFSSWVNSRKSRLVSADPNDQEHNEPWPGGRFNHYWFDLNRDWMVAQHPESQARINTYHQWRPNVLTDHHEMGTDATFFFMPGVPSRVHPLTPQKNIDLTKKIGEFHAKALDKIGSLYFTQEGYDDFYYGKGSTFPDLHGAIGILFEQASSRGHAQESVNGVLQFPFTILNQFTTALSSLKAVNALREELLEYQREFYKGSLSEGAKDPIKAFVFGSSKDKISAAKLAEMMARHHIDLYRPASSISLNGKVYDTESSFIVPMNQVQSRLIKAMFEKRSQFKDSIFYDISSWTMPLAYGTNYGELKTTPSLGAKVTEQKSPTGKLIGEKKAYAYVFETYGYYTPRSIYRLLKHGIRTKVATNAFHHPNGKRFEQGAIMVSVENQERTPEQIEQVIQEIIDKDGVEVYAFNTGLDYQGVSLGSNSFLTIRKPVIAMLVEGGVTATDAGELWHLLDQRFDIPVTLMPISLVNQANLNKYNTIIMPPGPYTALSDMGKEKLKSWVQNGNVLIGFETALQWLTTQGFAHFETKKEDDKTVAAKPRPYGDIDEYKGAEQTSGAIFEVTVDLTHPLLYGYESNKIALFKSNNLFMEKAKGAYSNPMVFGPAPLLSGYIWKNNYEKLKNTSAWGMSVLGKGKVIGFTESVNLRAFWLGTNKLFSNALFYGPLINPEAAR